ncbi:MAG: hypothetical protein OXI60_06505 [Acidiferrobacterales bacterium]|nr:hypothetical protein [Acidiferrobacterales bacterium]
MTERKANSLALGAGERIRQMPVLFESVDWFSNVGTEASDNIKQLVNCHLDGLGCFAESIRIVGDVHTLEDCIRNEFDSDWMDAETDAHDELVGKTKESQTSTSLDRVLTHIVTQQSSAILEYAQNRLPGCDRFLSRVAAGCATETCYRYAMETAVDPRGPRTFARKFELFRMGRWPLCLSNGQYILF